MRSRRAIYLGRLAGEPTEPQKSLIESAIELEWNALRAEAEGALVAYREGRELRRLFLRAVADYERTITVPVKTPGAALDEHLRRIAEKEAA